MLFIGVILAAPQQAPQSPLPQQSSQPRLIEALYQASRQQNEKDASQFLEQAQFLVQQGADVTAVGREQRTPLHWAVIGAMSARGEPQTRAFLEVVQLLIAGGADVNATDEFGATPLDYQENSSASNALTFVLLDSGAENGIGQSESARLKTLLDNLTSASQAGDLGLVQSALAFDLPIGTKLQVRLTSAVGSHSSHVGDVVEAVFVSPVLVGERLVIAPRTRMQGTVMLAQRASNPYERAQLILNFANIVQHDGTKTQIITRLVDVDNAREAVQDGRVVGLAYPNITKLNWGLRMLSVADPVLSYALESAVFVRDKEYKRAIEYPAGTDMTLTVEQPAKFGGNTLLTVENPMVPVDATPELRGFVQSLPLRTDTPKGTPSDLTNVLLVGSRDGMEDAFHAAGWSEANDLSLKSGLKTFAAVAESRGYRNAPVSLLLLDGRKPDIVFQKQTNTFSKRHHIRLWHAPEKFDGTDVWIAAATHDIGVAVQKGGREWYHRIEPQVDRERSKVTNDLAFAGVIDRMVLVDRPAAPRDSKNATGDRIITDGRMAVVFLQ